MYGYNVKYIPLSIENRTVKNQFYDSRFYFEKNNKIMGSLKQCICASATPNDKFSLLIGNLLECFLSLTFEPVI